MPDLSWETAELIVHNSIEEGASLIRVFNSKVTCGEGSPTNTLCSTPST